MFQGHLEYKADSLLREFLRDITRYLENQSDIFPEAPCGMFGDGVLRRFHDLKAAAAVCKSPRLLAMAPVSQARAELVNAWWTPAVSVYRRWLMWIAEAKSSGTARASVSLCWGRGESDVAHGGVRL